MTLTWTKVGGEYQSAHGRFAVRKNDRGKWEAYDAGALIGVRDHRGEAQSVCVVVFAAERNEIAKRRTALLRDLLTRKIQSDEGLARVSPASVDASTYALAREWLNEIEG